jgi:hypothetical protein
MTQDVYFTVTVDTEADNAWQQPDRIRLDNMQCIPPFQTLCEAHGIVPVYLVAYECATREEAVAVLKPIADRGACEIGYHFHAWTTPPFERQSRPGIDAQWLQAYQYELPDDLFREKANCLLQTIKETYGIAPTAHRAGRWGIDQRTIDWLLESGFVVDTSILPLRRQSTRDGHRSHRPSVKHSRMDPFLWPESRSSGSAARALVEIPLTVFHPASAFHRILVNYAASGWPGSRRALHLYYRHIGSKGQLRPNPAYSDDALDAIITSNLRRRPAILNLMIHSSELSLGTSPFSMTRASRDRVWEQLRHVFSFAAAAQMICLPLTEIAKIFERHLINNVRSRPAS